MVDDDGKNDDKDDDGKNDDKDDDGKNDDEDDDVVCDDIVEYEADTILYGSGSLI